MSKIRLGVLPIRLETGRYERPKLVAEQRFCQQCTLNLPENEIHFILECPSTSLIRDKLFKEVNDPDFPSLNNLEKLKYLLNSSEMVKQTSKFIINAFDNRLIP